MIIANSLFRMCLLLKTWVSGGECTNGKPKQQNLKCLQNWYHSSREVCQRMNDFKWCVSHFMENVFCSDGSGAGTSAGGFASSLITLMFSHQFFSCLCAPVCTIPTVFIGCFTMRDPIIAREKETAKNDLLFNFTDFHEIHQNGFVTATMKY